MSPSKRKRRDQGAGGPAETFEHLDVTHGDPPAKRMLQRPRRAVVTARTYGGDVVRMELDIVARAKSLVCVCQDRAGADPWHEWIPEENARPL